MKIQLGPVWHFSLAVKDPEKSAQFWTKNFDFQEMFRSDEAIGLTNNAMIIGFFKGTPHPDTIDHLSFHLDRTCIAGLAACGPVVSRSGWVSLGALGSERCRRALTA